MKAIPVDSRTTFDDLTRDPYPIYRRMRAEAPVIRVESVKRILLTRAADTKYVKDTPALFSSDDPNTPMAPAFQAHTLMRKDGKEHLRERMAMAKAYSPKVIASAWGPLYTRIVNDYLDRLPIDEVVDLFTGLCAPAAARILAHILGIPEATDDEMIRWSQTLMDGAGNFAWRPEPFERSDRANAEMNALFDSLIARHRAEPNPSAFSVLLNSADPIPMIQIYSNIKVAVGGGLNEPRDGLATIVYGLLTNPDQFEELKRRECWDLAFEEGVRWVAPIQASSRLVLEDTEIRGIPIPKGETVMTIQASANRDEELFEDGEVYDLFRKKAPHQAFGSGPHHCQGMHISRLTVGAIMLPILFERFPNMTLPDPDAVRWSGFGFRGPLNMPVRLN